jgi:hypothetical protein
MLIKVFLLALCLITLVVFAFGIKLIFDKNAKIPSGSCSTFPNDKNLSCGCNGGSCLNEHANK